MRNTLFIIRELTGGGAEKAFVDVVNGLKARGCPVEALVFFPTGEHFADLHPDIPVHVVYPRCSFRALTAFRLQRWLKISWLLKRDVRRCLGAVAPEITVSFVEGVPLLVQSWIPTKKKIAWVRTDLYLNHYTKKFFRPRQERVLYEKVDSILFVSKAAQLQFERLFPGMSKVLQVVYDPIDVPLIERLALASVVPKRKLTLCCVGRLSPEKGMDRFLLAVYQLKQEGFDFDAWLVGEGEERERLETKAVRLGLKDVFFLKGFHKNPYPFLRQADIFVSTSRAEGFSLVVCEALSLGVPVVSTRTAGCVELLKGDYGLLCDHSVDAIAEAIKSLLVSEERRVYFANRARERARLFDVKRSLDEIRALV